MHKVLVFDLDGTLAPISKGKTSKDIEKLKRLEKEGYKIGICSGKPTYYLCGFIVGLSVHWISVVFGNWLWSESLYFY